MSSQQRSPAKGRQPPDDPQGRLTRTRSQTGGQQKVIASPPQTPKKEKTICNGCGKEFQNIMTHLKAKADCAAHYDMKDMQAKMEAKRKELNAQRMSQNYHNSPEEASRKELLQEKVLPTALQRKRPQ